MASLASLSGRQKFVHNGQTVYEWEQGINEVLIFVKPPNVQAKEINVVITKNHLRVGLKNSGTYFLDNDLCDTIIQDDSFWTFDDGEIEINLQKMRKAETWSCAMKGHAELDPLRIQEVQKKMTLERFQEEHPGFDFSDAEFSGSAPDPREFMGGVSYK